MPRASNCFGLSGRGATEVSGIKVARGLLDWSDFEMMSGTELAQQMLRNKVVASVMRNMDADNFIPWTTDWILDQCEGLVVVRDVTQNSASRYGSGDRVVMFYFEREVELAAFKLRWHGVSLYDGPR